MANNFDQTIIAQATPVGSGAVAMLRISGSEAFDIVDKIAVLPSGKKFLHLDSHTVHFGYIENNGVPVDQVMFILMRGPKTFTGEDVVEITSHNNQFVIEEIIALAIKHGARLAQRGEFAKRAFLNNKIDLLQAESINELICASNQQSLKKSLSQIKGTFSQMIAQIEKELLFCMALSEASFEFLDDEMDFSQKILGHIQDIKIKISDLKSSYSSQSHIREGIRIAILGSVNAGKSSLFNALVKKDRAIVTDVAGTTRDSIEAGIYKKESFLTLVDTAGVRATQDIVELEGIKRSILEAEKSDIILLVIDGSRDLLAQELDFYSDLRSRHVSKIILVKNKIDSVGPELNLELNSEYISVSAKTGFGIVQLEQSIDLKIGQIMQSNSSPFLLNKRHYNLISSLDDRLDSVIVLLSSGRIEYEILSIHLKDALSELSELTGKSISEMSMDAIFKEFCVGK